MEKFNIVSVFIFSTEPTLPKLVEKSANKLISKVTNDVSYYNYIIQTALSIDELKELLETEDSDISSFITITLLDENSFKTVRTNMYKTFLSSIDNLFVDIDECDEIQLTETISSKDNEEDISDEMDEEDEQDTITDIMESLLKRGNIDEDSIMKAIDTLLDKGIETENDKKQYDMLVEALKKYK